MFVESLSLMLLGMGIVFSFLTLLMVAVRLMGNVIQNYFPEPEPAPVVRSTAAPAATQDQGEIVAAITMAIAAHRARTLNNFFYHLIPT